MIFSLSFFGLNVIVVSVVVLVVIIIFFIIIIITTQVRQRAVLTILTKPTSARAVLLQNVPVYARVGVMTEVIVTFPFSIPWTVLCKRKDGKTENNSNNKGCFWRLISDEHRALTKSTEVE